MALGKWFRGASAAPAEPAREYAVAKPDAEWRRQLDAERYRVLREHGTERPFTSPLNQEKRPGMFVCAGCGQDVFDAAAKFDSGTGWPSFHTPVAGGVETADDHSFLMRRVEVHCARCGGHLGHVFDDGPRPTGKRYCINGVSLDFRAGGEKAGG
ncbi:MAG: peptide-methionine (R)-S-oxide reductase MsrB [Rhodospirillales bacterium]